MQKLLPGLLFETLPPEIIMYSAEKLSTKGLKSVEMLYLLSASCFDATERLTTLSLDTMRNVIDDGAIGLKAFAAVKEPREALVLAVGMIEPTLLCGLSYLRGCYGIVTAWGATLSGLVEDQAITFEEEISAALEQMGRTLPDGGEAVSTAVKAAISQAGSVVGEAGKITRDVMGQAEANVIRNTDAMVRLVSSTARKAA